MECYFCKNKKDEKQLDWKDTDTLQKFLSISAKIQSRKKTGICAKHQRKVSRAVKRARVMGFLPFTTK